MARNLLDDDDWDHVGQIVETQLANHAKRLEDGSLAELKDQGVRLQASLAEIANQGSTVKDALNRAIADVGTDRSITETLKGTIGSGLLGADKQRQVNLLFSQLEASYALRVAHLTSTRNATS
jgi:hypothetical protein